MIRRILASPRPRRVYLLRDEFSTAQAAPLTSPRTAEPGPGQIKIGDPSNQISIVGGQIQASGGDGVGATFVAGNATIAYAAGRAMVIAGASEPSGNTATIGLSTSNSNQTGTWRATFEQSYYRNIATGAFVAVPESLDTTSRQFAFIRTADSGVWCFRDQALVWVDDSSSAAALYPLIFHATNASARPSVDAIRVSDLSGLWAVSEGIASVNASSPGSGAGYTATADGIHEIAFSLPGSPNTGDKIELRYRVADASNYWTVYVKYSGSAWDVFLDSVSGGTPTNRITVNGVGSTDKLRVMTNGTKHDVWTRASGAWTKRGGQVVVSFQDAQTTVNATFNAGTVSALKSYPRSQGLYNDLGGI